MSEKREGYAKEVAAGTGDARLDAPAYHRNAGPIAEVLAPLLAGRGSHIVEIGSGTGQHAAALAARFAGFTWWPTEPNAAHRRSVDAWRDHRGVLNMMPAVALDAASPDWLLGAAGMPPKQDLAAVLAINVLHITAWKVTLGLLAGAGRHLGAAGLLLIYGPFSQDGVHNASSNLAFDRQLKAQNPLWGVRDIADIEGAAAAAGLTLTKAFEMPANNRILAFEKTATACR